MIEIHVKNPEDQHSFEKALKIFKRTCQKDGFLQEVRDRRYFIKHSAKRHADKVAKKKRR